MNFVNIRDCHLFLKFLFIFIQEALVIYFIHISVYMSIPISPFIPPPPPPLHPSYPPLVSICLFSTSVPLFLPCKPVHLYHFSTFHMYALIYDICFSLSDLFHSVWQSLGPSTSLQMRVCHYRLSFGCKHRITKGLNAQRFTCLLFTFFLFSFQILLSEIVILCKKNLGSTFSRTLHLEKPPFRFEKKIRSQLREFTHNDLFFVSWYSRYSV